MPLLWAGDGVFIQFTISMFVHVKWWILHFGAKVRCQCSL